MIIGLSVFVDLFDVCINIVLIITSSAKLPNVLSAHVIVGNVGY